MSFMRRRLITTAAMLVLLGHLSGCTVFRRLATRAVRLDETPELSALEAVAVSLADVGTVRVKPAKRLQIFFVIPWGYDPSLVTWDNGNLDVYARHKRRSRTVRLDVGTINQEPAEADRLAAIDLLNKAESLLRACGTPTP